AMRAALPRASLARPYDCHRQPHTAADLHVLQSGAAARRRTCRHGWPCRRCRRALPVRAGAAAWVLTGPEPLEPLQQHRCGLIPDLESWHPPWTVCRSHQAIVHRHRHFVPRALDDLASLRAPRTVWIAETPDGCPEQAFQGPAPVNGFLRLDFDRLRGQREVSDRVTTH